MDSKTVSVTGRLQVITQMVSKAIIQFQQVGNTKSKKRRK
jgi:hypothetical protein|tara:strand:+ start:750 stop:869 length:120 start_codon:yes stop_codon:yes gene_type:complete